MSLITCESWEFIAKEQPEVLANRLRANVQQEWPLKIRTALLFGHVEGLRFEVKARSPARLPPTLKGDFQSCEGGTRVSIRIYTQRWPIFIPWAVLAMSVLYTLPMYWGAERQWKWWLPAAAAGYCLVATFAFWWDKGDQVAHSKEMIAAALAISLADLDKE